MLRVGTTFTSIVVALDLAPAGDRALPVVGALAALADVPVELLTVSSPHMDDTAAGHELQRRAVRISWPTDAYTIVHDHHPARAIVDHVRGRDVLLVMATTAKPPVTRHFLGSVSEEVLSLIDQPVLLVGPRVPSTFEMTCPTLIACIDDSDIAEAVR